MRRLKPVAVVGFGGYPTLPPLIAARLAGIPSIIHDANAVLGRANRFLSRHVSAIATSLPGVLDRDGALLGKATTVGTPMRPAILAAAAVSYIAPATNGPLSPRLLRSPSGSGAGADASVVAPPVDTVFYTPEPAGPPRGATTSSWPGGSSRTSDPSSRSRAATKAGVKLVVAGDGRARRSVEAAAGPTVVRRSGR